MENNNNNHPQALVIHQANSNVFSSPETYKQYFQMAVQLSKTSIIPKQYQGKPEDCLIAIEMANRMNVPAIMVLQNLDIIEGKPSFNAKFTVGLIADTHKYSNMRYEYEDRGEKVIEYLTGYGENTSMQKAKLKDLACRAYCTELSTGEKLYGNWVSVEMAVKDGWYFKKRSKWPHMTEQMLMYRAGSFWANQYEPGIRMGFLSTDEAEDIAKADRIVEDQVAIDIQNLNNAGKGPTEPVAEAVPMNTEKKSSDKATTPRKKSNDAAPPASMPPPDAPVDDEYI